MVLLSGLGPDSDIVANYLADRCEELVVVAESPIGRARVARRRAHKLGWIEVVGQALFMTVVLPALCIRGRRRRAEIRRQAGMDDTPRPVDHRVESVNEPGVDLLLRKLSPDVVVVNGTRIIAEPTLSAVDCPMINIHCGITPAYRGVHGGYWALVDGRPELVGTTVHLIDPGIDTGTVLAQATFPVTPADTFATYPDLHLAAGLPALAGVVAGVLAGHPVHPCPVDPRLTSRLRYHPTLWGYLRTRWTRGVR